MSPGPRPVILVFSDYYLPGYKSGGGMRTIVNMVNRLSHIYDFRIVTRDHDGKRDRKQYDSVKIDEWNQIGDALVFYISKTAFKLPLIRKLIKEVNPTALYTNSYFSTLAISVLKLRKVGAIPNLPVIIAPCGELSTGALALKSAKKKLYMGYASVLNLYSDIVWKASGEEEAEEVRRLDLGNAKVFVAPDLTPAQIFADFDPTMKPLKAKGKARFVFSSRFVKKKNFNWLIPLLIQIEGEIELDIIAPIEDQSYWNETRELIASLPANVRIRSVGSVEHETLLGELAKYHFFICPTLGENFGHVFLEAMAAGCPLILSDRTPWKDLEDLKIGWDIPLEAPAKWQAVIQKCVDMDHDQYSQMSNNARAYSVRWTEGREVLEATKRVLDYSIGLL